DVSFEYAVESDEGPYPFPPDVRIEGGPGATGDRHVILLDTDACVAYELYAAWPRGDGTWRAGSGAIFDLRSNQLRPAGWTSTDAAGLPIIAGLVRYEEVAAGYIDHAIRFTAPAPGTTTSGPRGTRRHAPPIPRCRRWGPGSGSRPASTSRASRPRPAWSPKRSSDTG